MIIIDLIYNLFALLSLSVVSNFLDQKYDRKTLTGQILQGLLFGIIGIIGMAYPYVFEKGIIFDGRSIVLSLSSLFFGPLTGAISASLTFFYRIYLGGEGTIPGVLVIVSSFLWGYFFYKKIEKKFFKLNNLTLYLFGIIVHITMIVMMAFLPKLSMSSKVIEQLGPTVIIFYPIITLAIGRIILNFLNYIENVNALKNSEELFKNHIL